MLWLTDKICSFLPHYPLSASSGDRRMPSKQDILLLPSLMKGKATVHSKDHSEGR